MEAFEGESSEEEEELPPLPRPRASGEKFSCIGGDVETVG